MPSHLLPTTVVGSYPQPDWLINREMLSKMVPRTRVRELWRVAPEFLEQAQDDATLLAIRDMERAGIDIITDGEMRRESYSNRFATALEGIDLDNPGTALDRSGHPNPVPRIVGKIRRKHAVEVEDLLFLKRHTSRMVKITVPGPFTMSQQAQNDFYPDLESAAMDYAVAVNAEIRDLFAAGADIVQIDEPYMQARPEPARAYGLRALNRALEGITGTTAAGSENHSWRDRPVEHADRNTRGGGRSHPARPTLRRSREHHHRARLRHEIPAARCCLRQDAGDGRGRAHHAARSRLKPAAMSAIRSSAASRPACTRKHGPA
jgi:hypothetical protein